MDNCDKAPPVSELKEKLRSSLASLESTQRTIQSISENLSALEEDWSCLFDALNTSRNEGLFLGVPYDKHRSFINQLEKLCKVRRTLNEYKSTMDAMGNLNMDCIIKLMKEKFEREEATEERLVEELEQLQVEFSS